MMKYTIPLYQPSLLGNEKKYVNECLDSTWISSKGAFVGKFEDEFAKYLSVKHAASVSNGTVALHVALLALGIGPGDEVIIPTLTYISSANAITYTGATVVFADSLESTWQLNPDDVAAKITSKTRAVMAVHLYGHACDMDSLVRICKDHQLFLIEDCAESIGTFYKGKHVGSFGDIAAFSFFGNKTITTGEGGMVVTNDETLHDRTVHFKGQGLAKHRQYWHDVVGYNYRMTNICAAIGLAQLERVEIIVKQKRQLAQWYQHELRGLPVTFHIETENVVHSFWMCSILVPEASQRDELRNYLEENGVETRPLFFPIHTMPMYSGRFQRHPVAENLAWRGINLPSFPLLKEEEVVHICQLIRTFFK